MSERTKAGIKLGVFFAVLIAGILLLTGCSPEQLAMWKGESAVATEQINEMKADYDQMATEYRMLALIGSPEAAVIAEKMAEKADKINLLVDTVNSIDAKIQNADSGWDIAQGLIDVATTFFPVAGVAGLAIRAYRRRFEGVVEAMSEAGGPLNPAVASRAMEPKLKAAVDRARRKIGDTTDRSMVVSNGSTDG